MKKLIYSIIILSFLNNCYAVETAGLASYDEKLIALYSNLGAMHYIYNICYSDKQTWRDYAQSLTIAEHLNTTRRKALFAAFNTNYRTFATTYRSCTAEAKKAYQIYKKQSISLTNELLEKYAYCDK